MSTANTRGNGKGTGKRKSTFTVKTVTRKALMYGKVEVVFAVGEYRRDLVPDIWPHQSNLSLDRRQVDNAAKH